MTDRCAYGFIAPYYIFFLLFVLFPIVVNIFLSFTDFNLKSISFVGLENYRMMLKDVLFWKSVQNTLIYVVFTVFFTMLLGFLLALALNSAALWGTRFFRGMIYLPYVTSMVSMAMVWLWLYDPTYGVFNVIMEALGLEAQQWLYDEKLALGAMIVLGIWKGVGYYMTLYLAGLYNIPAYLYEAAAIDGAGYWQKVFRITLPMLRPVTFFILITGTINAFNVFEQVNVMTVMVIPDRTTPISIHLPKHSVSRFPLRTDKTVNMSMAAVVVLIPPAVPAGEPPMNISIHPSRRELSVRPD